MTVDDSNFLSLRRQLSCETQSGDPWPLLPTDVRSALPAYGLDLTLAEIRIGVESDIGDLIEHVRSVMVPPCRGFGRSPDPDWRLLLERVPLLDKKETEAVFSDRPVLSLTHNGPRLAIVEDSGKFLQAVGLYRPHDAAVRIEVHAAERMTRVLIPADGGNEARWGDYIARVFFASRMLAGGWRMLHASAVALGGAAVVFLAPQGGGKSTLAHRACRELGAEFLADDLVLISSDGTVVGWPTRVALPTEMMNDSAEITRSAVAGRRRSRVVFNPAEHRAAFDTACSPPVPLGALVCVESDVHSAGPVVQSADLVRSKFESFVASAADVPAQRLFVSDLIGLTGGPRPYRHDTVPEGSGPLYEVPTACLKVGDMSRLGHVPLWESLDAVLSRVGKP